MPFQSIKRTSRKKSKKVEVHKEISRQTSLEDFFKVIKDTGGEFFPSRIAQNIEIPTEVFVNREKEYEEIIKLINQSAKRPYTGMIVPLQAHTGSGKSAFLKYINKKLNEEKKANACYYVAKYFLQNKVELQQKISQIEAPKMVIIDHLEELETHQAEEFIGDLKYLAQNVWKHTLIIFATTTEFYEKKIKPLLYEKISVGAVFDENPIITNFQLLNPEEKKRAIKNWIKYLTKQYLGQEFNSNVIFEEEVLDLLNEFSIGDAFKKLNDKFYEFSNCNNPLQKLPLKSSDFKPVEKKDYPKILILTTHNENEIQKIRNGIEEKGPDFFSSIQICKNIPYSSLKRVINNLIIVDRIQEDYLAKVLFISRIFAEEKYRLKLNIDESIKKILTNEKLLIEEEAIKVLSESPFGKYLELKQVKLESVGTYKDLILQQFEKVPNIKDPMGTEAFYNILRIAKFEPTKQETGKKIRPDIKISSKNLSLEFAFISPNKKGSLKPYIANKIFKYYSEYSK